MKTVDLSDEEPGPKSNPIFIDEAAGFRRENWLEKLAMTGTVLALGAGLSGAIAVLGDSGKSATKETQDPLDTSWVPWVAFALGLLLIVALVAYLVVRRQYMANQNKGYAAKLKAQAQYHKEALEKLRRATELNTLMELNQDQIGDYHKIVTDQADKAFKSSRTAMWVGLVLLVAAAIGGVKVPLEEMRWFLGALAAFSTLLSGYLSSTYMVLYRESISQLNRYFDQPVLNSYFLTAERLVAGASADPAFAQAVRQQIVNEVLASSSRLTEKPAVAAPAVDSEKPKKKQKRIPKQAQASVNGQSLSGT
ncbi:hypothetical protein [Streptomyces rhizosphaerihabitans]|uniref:hypothetical protein n=1 Tax=Streptomyces rhizosphaerihabitans TaxID=1266770 RepID=UPI0021BE363B|nr:hypothetical protein [Streptomyces rhizosphaerihabitans]MCT9010542.1 hypothetical protein [Streptomyces rhizosphaerihabitans]